jgi:hypothetical protein
MKWAEPICIRCLPSRASGDCGILAIACLTGSTYEDVLALAGRVGRLPHRHGLFTTQIRRIARCFGLELKKKAKVDWAADTGIVEVWCNANRMENGYHVVVLRYGLIVDAEQVWQPDDFLRHYQCDVRGILVPRGDDNVTTND